jgi:uncharacterized protein with von Willebrand factor type A (vWA) domain
MAETARHPARSAGEGKLAANVTNFARALRRAGMPVGTGRVVDAIRAIEAVGFGDRRDFYFTLQACFVSRPEHRAVFARVFRLFWRGPRLMEHKASPPTSGGRGPDDPGAEALLDASEIPELPDPDGAEYRLAMTFSTEERLRQTDFERMSAAEIAVARRAIARLALPARPNPSRRPRASSRGRIAAWRTTMRGALRVGG